MVDSNQRTTHGWLMGPMWMWKREQDVILVMSFTPMLSGYGWELNEQGNAAVVNGSSVYA